MPFAMMHNAALALQCLPLGKLGDFSAKDQHWSVDLHRGSFEHLCIMALSCAPLLVIVYVLTSGIGPCKHKSVHQACCLHCTLEMYV